MRRSALKQTHHLPYPDTISFKIIENPAYMAAFPVNSFAPGTTGVFFVVFKHKRWDQIAHLRTRDLFEGLIAHKADAEHFVPADL